MQQNAPSACGSACGASDKQPEEKPILMFRACLPVTLHCGLGVGIRTKHRSGKGYVNSVGLNCNRYIMFGVWGYCFVSVGSFPVSS